MAFLGGQQLRRGSIMQQLKFPVGIQAVEASQGLLHHAAPPSPASLPSPPPPRRAALPPAAGEASRQMVCRLAAAVATGAAAASAAVSSRHLGQRWRNSSTLRSRAFGGATAEAPTAEVPMSELGTSSGSSLEGNGKRRRGAPFAEGSTQTVRIEALTSRGQGLGRFGDSRWVVMIFGALPGELVTFRVARNYRSTSEGQLLEVLERSPERVEPRCPVFRECSGCQYQHLNYESQLTWKRRHVLDSLTRIGRLGISEETIAPTEASPNQYHYRTKMTPHFQMRPPARRAAAAAASTWPSEEDEAQVSIGFVAEQWGDERDDTGRRWRDTVDVEQCPIATVGINEAKVNKVFGIELDKTAIGLAKRNAITRGLENTSFMAADAGDGLAWVSRELGATAATGASVIVDPPRQGLAKGARAALLAWRPRRVVYVSCDPGTQARDLQDFVTAGYTLTRVTPFDLFPQTRHLEAVAVLDRRVLD
eukprot:TRINITY_DN8784_c0_g1_i3.p1 TRINITY_DN8784_c0_g1~~TRINITY_DN8784_c0_g1_i3.p1  ORF type:complete len:492 (+),score=113.39 TRINITY_DN8784_c0_g1_i3:41-1477(+)